MGTGLQPVGSTPTEASDGNTEQRTFTSLKLQIHDLAARRDELDDQLPELAYKLDCLCQKEEFISQIQNVVELQIEELWVEVHCLKQQIEEADILVE